MECVHFDRTSEQSPLRKKIIMMFISIGSVENYTYIQFIYYTNISIQTVKYK